MSPVADETQVMAVLTARPLAANQGHAHTIPPWMIPGNESFNLGGLQLAQVCPIAGSPIDPVGVTETPIAGG